MKRVAALIAAVVALVSCTDESTPGRAAPDATERPTAVAAPAQDATPKPTVAPVMVTGICPQVRQKAGLEYEYDSNKMNRTQALDAFCGIFMRCVALSSDVIRQMQKGTAVSDLIGNCYSHDILVWQFDTATGPCSFLGFFTRYDPFDREIYGTDDLAQYGYTYDPSSHWLVETCPDLDTVFEDDIIGVDALYISPYTYEVPNGSRNTVPAFEILRVRK